MDCNLVTPTVRRASRGIGKEHANEGEMSY
jgi:hypothetical protein